MSTNFPTTGFRPWRISFPETVVHSIPGVGMVTAFASSLYRRDEMNNINMKLVGQSTTRVQRVYQRAIEEDQATESGEEVYIEVEDTASCAPFEEGLEDEKLVLEREEISAKRANARALCVLNLAVTGLAFATLYGLKTFHQI